MKSRNLPSEWKLTDVKDLIELDIIEKPLDGNHGNSHPKASDYVDGGIPFIMASNLQEGIVDFNSCKFISINQAHSLRKGFAKTGDVLLSHKATIGKTAIIQENNFSMLLLTPQATYYRVKNKEKLSNWYLKYYFDSKTFQDTLNNWAGSGSTRAYLGIKEQQKLPIIIPPINEQKKIEKIGYSIDSKIYNNIRLNKKLEELSQTIFKSWFVDFDPVHAKKLALEKNLSIEQAERAAMAIISGVCSPIEYVENFEEMDKKLSQKLSKMSKDKQDELAHTASLFPSEFVDSILGNTPKEWNHKEIQEVFEVRDGTHDSPKKATIGYHLVTSRHIIDGELNLSKAYKVSEEDFISINKRSKVNIGDILITMIGTVGETLLIQNEPDFAIKNIGLFKSSQRRDLMYFVDQHLKTKMMKSYMEARLAGTTQKYLLLTELRKFPLLLISDEILSEFNTLLEPIYIQINTNNKTNKRLSKFRDTLLPKLLTGKIDLSNIKLNDEDSRSA